MSDPKFVKLSTKLVIALDNISHAVQENLNSWVLIPKQCVAPAVPKMDAHEYSEFCETLKAAGILLEVAKIPRQDDAKVAVAPK